MQDAVKNPTFAQWIRGRTTDRTRLRRVDGGGLPWTLGSVARWIAADECFPARSRTVDHILLHLAAHFEPPAEVAVRAAWALFREEMAAGGKVPKRGRKDAVHRGYLVPRPTADRIRDLALAFSRAEGRPVTQGDIIAKGVGRLRPPSLDTAAPSATIDSALEKDATPAE